jgi:predicted DNA-binding protein
MSPRRFIVDGMRTTSSFRLPDELRERIREQAQAERRSFSNQCRILLERALTERERRAAAEPQFLPYPADELEWH